MNGPPAMLAILNTKIYLALRRSKHQLRSMAIRSALPMAILGNRRSQLLFLTGILEEEFRKSSTFFRQEFKKDLWWQIPTFPVRGHTLITFNMFLSIFDQLSTLVSIFTIVPDNSYSTVVSILQTKWVPLCANVIKVWPLTYIILISNINNLEC